jgi:hypothetical protein
MLAIIPSTEIDIHKHTKMVSTHLQNDYTPSMIMKEQEIEQFYNRFKDFISFPSLSEKQYSIALITAYLLALTGRFHHISFQYSITEKELIFARKSDKGIGLVVIDQDGDLMLSNSPYAGQGWRKFLDSDIENFDYYQHISRLISE